MARKNSTRRVPQRLKGRVEDHMLRRALRRDAEQSYRDEATARTYAGGHLTITFTDPSWTV